MPTITVPITIGAAIDYARTCRNSSPIGGDVWANRLPGLISATLSTSGSTTRTDVSANVNIADENTTIEFTDIVFDMSLLGLVTITAARFYFTTGYVLHSGLWGTPLYDNLALVSQLETTRSNAPDGDNYLAIYDGAINGTEYGNNRLSLSGMSAATAYSFTLNAAGVAYLNTILTKANLQKYAIFGITMGGVVDGVNPEPLTYGSYNDVSLSDDMYFELDYTTASGCAVNIADVWKDIVGAQINTTGAAWKAVSDIQTNVGEDWKDRA